MDSTDPMDSADSADSVTEPRTRLAELWRKIERRPSFAHAAVVVPSLSFDADELAKIPGVAFYEERLLFLLMRLRHPAARVLYLSSQPIPAEVVEYYLELLVGVPASHARSRLTLLCVNDARPISLTQKILERPRMVARIRAWIGAPTRAYLSCFNTTVLEQALAEELKIPLNGADPSLLQLGTKSGSRKVFREAGVALPAGFEDVHGRAELIDRLLELEGLVPGIEKAVIKLNSSFSGAGNATFTFPPERRSRAAVGAALETVQWSAASESREPYFAKLEALGGIVEEFIEADEVRSPSVQMRITPFGEIQQVSTHEQVLSGPTAQVYTGCSFPASEEYRAQLARDGYKIAEVLRDQGVVSRFAVDFMAWRSRGSAEWSVAAIEINLRLGSTTFPFLALEFLTNGTLDSEGHFVSARGVRKYYVATDALASPNYRGLLPADLMDLMIAHSLIFDPSRETGVLFHMIGALSQHGKLGVIAVGNSPDEALRHFDETRRVLDQETGLRRKTKTAVHLPPAARRID